MLFKTGDDGELARMVEMLLTDDELRSRLVTKGLETLKAHHSMQQFVAQVEQVYEKALA